ncbi:MAG: hypothetical protein D3910_16295 [Candidatus Electrothrix sp. ATG2]|nr:hypothetical protein [Candidatus Electrothrix sp. ATG2]
MVVMMLRSNFPMIIIWLFMSKHPLPLIRNSQSIFLCVNVRNVGYMNGNRRIYRAWVLSDEFKQFWNFKDQASAEDFLDSWCKSANKSRLEPIKKIC